jgi:hypothetical protein
LVGAVNKCLLSTGETREFVSKSEGVDLNLGVDLAPPRDLSSNWREGTVRKTWAMWRIRTRMEGVPLSTEPVIAVGAERQWLPGMDSNHDSRLQRPLSYH